MRLCVILLLAIVPAVQVPVSAWGEAGHQAVVVIASSRSRYALLDDSEGLNPLRPYDCVIPIDLRAAGAHSPIPGRVPPAMVLSVYVMSQITRPRRRQSPFSSTWATVWRFGSIDERTYLIALLGGEGGL